jgi:UDP-3-O-[3-hydroxymyristoyl] glucosamine N-acyltransferase
MVGHNCTIGPGVVISAQAGLSGSTTLERFAMIGGQAGFAGHLVVGAGARVGAKAGVMGDIPPKQAVIGTPAIPQRLFWRQVAALKKLIQRKEAGN